MIKYGMQVVHSSGIFDTSLFNSNVGNDSNKLGIKPVVSLKISVKVTSEGVVSK